VSEFIPQYWLEFIDFYKNLILVGIT